MLNSLSSMVFYFLKWIFFFQCKHSKFESVFEIPSHMMMGLDLDRFQKYLSLMNNVKIIINKTIYLFHFCKKSNICSIFVNNTSYSPDSRKCIQEGECRLLITERTMWECCFSHFGDDWLFFLIVFCQIALHSSQFIALNRTKTNHTLKMVINQKLFNLLIIQVWLYYKIDFIS